MTDRTARLQHAVELFTDRIAADPALAPWFVDVDVARLRRHQRDFLLATVGGPELYAGRDMATAHAGLDIDDPAFDRAVDLLRDSLRDAGIAEDVVAAVERRVAPLRSAIVAA